MFSDYEAETVSFYKKKKNIIEEFKSIQTDDFEIEVEDKLIQTPIRKNIASQTEISEIVSWSKEMNLDQEKMRKFLEKVEIILK